MKEAIAKVETRGEELGDSKPAAEAIESSGSLDEAPGSAKDGMVHETYEVSCDPICHIEVPELVSSDNSIGSFPERDSSSAAQRIPSSNNVPLTVQQPIQDGGTSASGALKDPPEQATSRAKDASVIASPSSVPPTMQPASVIPIPSSVPSTMQQQPPADANETLQNAPPAMDTTGLANVVTANQVNDTTNSATLESGASATATE